VTNDDGILACAVRRKCLVSWNARKSCDSWLKRRWATQAKGLLTFTPVGLGSSVVTMVQAAQATARTDFLGLNIAGSWPLDSSSEKRSWSHACYILRGTTSQSLGNPILAESCPVSSKPISETDIDERNLFRRRGPLQESPRNGASEIQGCQEMLADHPTKLQIGLTADIARVTKIRWP